MEQEKKNVDDIVAMLDGFMNQGGGHVNLDVNDPNACSKDVKTYACSTCGTKLMPCEAPTLMQGMDNTEDDGK
ncbi:MAG: hypothetical protein II688_01550 [Lachnospiraceae bacterium]|jgi:hypothetical protein|nr:hypothetical protein [Lachnospiraceae bacterium]